ncbi:MAG: protein kinase domain-containing protein, partial [Planctomycetota bacterium]
MIAAGSHIGGYHIQRLLGRGAMGEVYLAEQVSLRRPVALKRIAGHLLDNEDAIARFEREAQCIARITSQHVVMVHDFGRFRDESGEEHYLLVMELVEGGTSLADCIAEPVDWRLATSVIRQMAEGLAAAAEQDVIHRDIKPGNVMLSSRGVAKLCDFGLARALDSTAMTMEGSLLGTPLYMSPEACRGESVGPASDIYSLGVTWYQMLAGVPPFSAGNMMALLRMHLEEQPQPLAEIAPETPPQVLSLVEQCMAKDLSLRIDSARRLDQAIQALATEGLVVPQRVEDLVAASGARSAAPSTLATMLTDPGAATATVPGGASAPAASAETIAGQTLGPEDPGPDPALTVAPAGPPTAATQLPPPAPERRGSRVPVIAAVLALVAAGVGVALWRPWQAADAPAPAMMPPAAPDAQGSQARSPEPDPGDGRERDPGDGPVDPDPASVGAEQMASDPAVAVITAVEQAVEAGDPLAARLRLDALDSDHPRYAQVAQAVVALEQEQAAAAAREQALAAIEAALAAAEPQRARALLEQHATKLDPAQRERMTASVDQLAARQARQRAVSDVEEALADGDVEQARSRLAAQAETIGADARAQLAEQIDALAVEQARARAREQARVAEAARQKQIAQITAALEAGELERARELLAGLD